MPNWQLQEAKARFSELVKRAQDEGPQDITVHGKAVAVLMSRAEYERMKPKPNLVDFMRASPLHGLELDFTREQDFGREIDFGLDENTPARKEPKP